MRNNPRHIKCDYPGCNNSKEVKLENTENVWVCWEHYRYITRYDNCNPPRRRYSFRSYELVTICRECGNIIVEIIEGKSFDKVEYADGCQRCAGRDYHIPVESMPMHTLTTICRVCKSVTVEEKWELTCDEVEFADACPECFYIDFDDPYEFKSMPVPTLTTVCRTCKSKTVEKKWELPCDEVEYVDACLKCVNPVILNEGECVCDVDGCFNLGGNIEDNCPPYLCAEHRKYLRNPNVKVVVCDNCESLVSIEELDHEIQPHWIHVESCDFCPRDPFEEQEEREMRSIRNFLNDNGFGFK